MEAALKEARVVLPAQTIGEPSEHLMAAEGLRMMSSSIPDHQNPRQPLPLSPPATDQFNSSSQWTPTAFSNAGEVSDRQKSQTPQNGGQCVQVLRSSPSAIVEGVSDRRFREQACDSSINGSLIDANIYAESNSDPKVYQNLKEPVDSEGTESIACPENSDWEYHGPGSFLSICSKPGIQWVVDKTGSSDFISIARSFSREVTRPLKLGRKISSERVSEPDQETAWKYARAYFEKTPEATFNIIVRSSFETRLRNFFQSGDMSGQDEDAAWYALRNTIYAFGCRSDLGKGSYANTFQEAQAGGWRYFENALSRHSELMFCRTGLMAVEALVAMVGRILLACEC
jgi:hypothetical protein